MNESIPDDASALAVLLIHLQEEFESKILHNKLFAEVKTVLRQIKEVKAKLHAVSRADPLKIKDFLKRENPHEPVVYQEVPELIYAG